MNKLMLLLIVVVSIIILLPVLLLEGAACAPGDAHCDITWPTRTPVPPTPTAPLPDCYAGSTVPCFTPAAPDPNPWPTYEAYPAPYPAPDEAPEPYPSYPGPTANQSSPSEDTANQAPEQSLANSIWAWVLDLFTN